MEHKEKVQIHRGMDRVRRGQYEEAVDIFDKVIAQNPESVEAWNNRGVALFRAGRPDEAIASYDRSLELDPENLDALRNKGFVLRALGRLDEALEAYDKVMTIGGSAADLEAIAAIFVGQGKLDEALGVLSEAIRADPIPRFEDEMKMIIGLREQRMEALRRQAEGAPADEGAAESEEDPASAEGAAGPEQKDDSAESGPEQKDDN
jgi:tetratricopeptide (TPR) repeat protein